MLTPRTIRGACRSMLMMLALALMPAAAAAQQTGRIAGTVTDANGQPLAGAQVVVVGADLGAITTYEGTFAIAGVPAGTHTLEITQLGYRDAVVPSVVVRAGETARADASMEAQALDLAGIVVSASREAERITDAPATITRIDAEAIRNSAGNSFTGVLSEVVGLNIVRTGVAGVAVNARGFNSSFNNRMLMMVDGRIAVLPENGLPVGQFTTVPKIDLAAVEVLIGPGAALYGPDASNGVLTLVTKDPRKYPGTTVSVTGGTRNYKDVQVRHAGVTGDWGYKIAAEWQEAHSWENDLTYGGGASAIHEEDFIDVDWMNSVARAEGALVYYNNGASRGELSAGYSVTDGVGQTNVGRNQLVDWTYNFVQAEYTTPHWYFNIYRTQSQSGESFAIDRFVKTKAVLEANGASMSDEEIRLLSDWPSNGELYAAEVQHNFTVSRLLDTEVVVGAQYRHDVVSSDGEWLDDRKTGEPIGIDQFGVYAQTETPIGERFELILAARYDRHQDYDPQFSPKAGLLYHPADDQTLRLTYNRAFKSPSTLQTHFFIPGFIPRLAPGVPIGLGVYGNTDGFVIKDLEGNVVRRIQPLVPEENQTWELGYKGVILDDRLYVDVAGYYASYENFFGSLGPIWPAAQLGTVWAYNAAGERIDAPDGTPQWVFTYQNLGGATIYGTDTGARFLLTPSITLEGTFSWIELSDVKKEREDQATNPLNAPSVKWTLGADFERLTPRLFGSVDIRHVTGYDFVSGINQGKIPTFNTLDLGLGYRIPELGAQINLSVNNLFTCHARYEADDSDTLCGFGEEHTEMVNMPAVGTMLYLGVRYHRE